jgi:membrane-associated phospholipid phosphatase
MRVALFGAVLSVLLASDGVQAQRVGTPSFEQMHTRPALLLSSDTWIAAGFVAGTVGIVPLDRSLAHMLQDSSRQESRILQKTASGLRFLGFPGSVLIGLSVYAAGHVIDDRRVAAFGLHGTEAIVLTYPIVWVGKNTLGRARPYDDADNPFNFKFGRGFAGDDRYRSFPSGHTAAAFAVAAALTAESGRIWPEAKPYAAPVLFAGATLIGISRMYQNRHWASDVVAGAAIGVLTGSALIRYVYSRDTRLDQWLLPAEKGSTQQVSAARPPQILIVWLHHAF